MYCMTTFYSVRVRNKMLVNLNKNENKTEGKCVCLLLNTKIRDEKIAKTGVKRSSADYTAKCLCLNCVCVCVSVRRDHINDFAPSLHFLIHFVLISSFLFLSHVSQQSFVCHILILFTN